MRCQSSLMQLALGGLLFTTFLLLIPTARAVVPYHTANKHNQLADLNPEDFIVRVDNGLVITVNVTAVEESGQWVKLSWCCVTNPTRDDWIGMYAPGDVDPVIHTPAHYWDVGYVDGYIESGSGSLSVQVYNHRTDTIRFLFVRKERRESTVIGSTTDVKVMNVNQPLHGHLALTGKERELLIQWSSKDGRLPRVVWGTKSNEYTYSAMGETNIYTKDDLCLATSGWIQPGALHHAVMTNIEPGKQYYYKYGDQIHGMSEEFSFFGPPLKGSIAAVKFLAYGDLGSSGDYYCLGAANTTARLLKEVEDSHLVLHNGDISYAMGYQGIWDIFLEKITPIATRVPYMTSVGNHERDWPGTSDRYYNVSDDSGGECGAVYRRRFRMPVAEPESQYWYSFDLGPIHFLILDTEDDFAPGSIQHNFVVEDLKKVERSNTPWLIAAGHRPMYVGSPDIRQYEGDLAVQDDLQAAFESLFLEYKVDVVLQGHHHGYQRTCPVFRRECMAMGEAPVYIDVGNAGAHLTIPLHYHFPSHFKSVAYEFGYTRFWANTTDMSMESVRSSDGTLIDSLHFSKSLPTLDGLRIHGQSSKIAISK